jgi:hypothetical protein
MTWIYDGDEDAAQEVIDASLFNIDSHDGQAAAAAMEMPTSAAQMGDDEYQDAEYESLLGRGASTA